jgi:hypothetical protein
MKRLFLVCALILGALVVQPAFVRGQALSPVGSWQVTVMGTDKGTAMMTFSNDLTVSGYGITRRQFGLFTLAGTWNFNKKGDVVVAYVQTLDNVGTAFTFTAHLLRPGKFRAQGVNDNHGVFHFKGEQPLTFPNVSGFWTGVVHRSGKTLIEQYTITGTNVPALFNITGQGLSDTASFTLTGAIIANSHNQINASIDRTFGTSTQSSSLSGTFRPAKSQMQLTGTDDTGADLTEKATQ